MTLLTRRKTLAPLKTKKKKTTPSQSKIYLVICSDDTELELFGHRDHAFVWRREADTSVPKTDYMDTWRWSGNLTLVLLSGIILGFFVL